MLLWHCYRHIMSFTISSSSSPPLRLAHVWKCGILNKLTIIISRSLKTVGMSSNHYLLLLLLLKRIMTTQKKRRNEIKCQRFLIFLLFLCGNARIQNYIISKWSLIFIYWISQVQLVAPFFFVCSFHWNQEADLRPNCANSWFSFGCVCYENKLHLEILQTIHFWMENGQRTTSKSRPFLCKHNILFTVIWFCIFFEWFS